MGRLSPGKMCRHCHHRIQRDARGLCDVCYGNGSIRSMYPFLDINGNEVVCGCPGGSRGRQGDGTANLGPVGVGEPTDAPPGTEGKIAAIQERLRNRQELWHPEDYREPNEWYHY